jgi:hypothetical protein
MMLNTKLDPNAHSLESLEVLIRFIEVLLREFPDYGVHPLILYSLSDYYNELKELVPIVKANAIGVKNA